MWRSRLGWAGLASLLLHALLLVLLLDSATVRPLPEPQRPAPLFVEVLTPPAQRPPEPPAPTPPSPRPPEQKPAPRPTAEPEKPPKPKEPPPPQPTAKPEPPEPEEPPQPSAEPEPPKPEEPPQPSAGPEPSEPEAPAPRQPSAGPEASRPPEPASAAASPPQEPPPASAPPPAGAPPPGPETAPTAGPTPAPAGDTPRGAGTLTLLPPSVQEGWSLPGPLEAPRGRTLRPGDPSLSPEVLAAEERARVGGRVQGFMKDQLAQLRVENGLVHPYFGKLRAALETQLEGAPIFGPDGLAEGVADNLQHMVRNYERDAERFGATGNPGGAVPRAPTPSELLKQRVGDEPAYRGLRARMQAGEELRTLGDGGRSAGLVVVLELEQGPDGALRAVKVVKKSGNGAYDAYVLDKVPAALARLAPPPPQASGVRPEGIHTVWAVEGRIMYRRKLSELKGQDAWYLAAMAAGGVLTGSFEETTGDIYVVDLRNPWFSIQPRLVRVY